MDIPAELDLVVGDEFRHPITGAGSQGYRWQVDVAGDTGAVSATTQSVAPDNDVGVGSYPKQLCITARSPGTVNVRLTLARQSGRVREQHDVRIRVREAPV